MEGLQWWCIHDLSLSLERGGRRRGRTTREARAKIAWEHGPIYATSQDPQVDQREAHFWEESSRSPK
jgi:hypothetical protein